MANKPSTAAVAAGVAGIGLLAYLFLRGRNAGPYLPGDIDVPVITEPPTMTRQAARIIADAIYSALYGSGGFGTGSIDEDEAAVIALLAQPRNDADVLLVIDEYGVRGWLWTGDFNLPGAIARYLSPSDISEINDGFARRGINLRF